MTELKKGVGMSDMECPYCGADQDVCHDDGHGYEEDVRHEHFCTECQKHFVFYTTISFHYDPIKADCLNGAEHDLQMTRTYPRQFSKMKCARCNYERDLTSNEMSVALDEE